MLKSALIKQIRRYLSFIIQAKIGNYHDAEDVTQMALLNVIRHARNVNTIFGLAKKVAVHAIWQYYQDRADDAELLAPVAIDDNLSEEWAHLECDDILAWYFSGAKEYEHPGIDIDLLDIEAAFKQLSDKHQQILYLRAEGYNYGEIAHLTALPLGTVRSQIHYGRKQLEKLLAA